MNQSTASLQHRSVLKTQSFGSRFGYSLFETWKPHGARVFLGLPLNTSLDEVPSATYPHVTMAKLSVQPTEQVAQAPNKLPTKCKWAKWIPQSPLPEYNLVTSREVSMEADVVTIPCLSNRLIIQLQAQGVESSYEGKHSGPYTRSVIMGIQQAVCGMVAPLLALNYALVQKTCASYGTRVYLLFVSICVSYSCTHMATCMHTHYKCDDMEEFGLSVHVLHVPPFPGTCVLRRRCRLER